MKITNISICPSTEGTIKLTPELMASCFARFSRSDEGIEAINAKVDLDDPSGSIESIFKFIDYGHASIADMVPVAMTLEKVSIFMAFYIWNNCQVVAGQESSTRYLKIDELIDLDLGAEHQDYMNQCMEEYNRACEYFDEQLPQSDDPKGERLRKNKIFDRARYFIPVAAATNVALIMSARCWCELSSKMQSHYLVEFQECGHMIAESLAVDAPHMVKHAAPKVYYTDYYDSEFVQFKMLADSGYKENYECESHLWLPPQHPLNHPDLYQYHQNRYAPFHPAVSQCPVIFGWSHISMGEMRDFNRHRTGTRSAVLVPSSFYCVSYKHGLDMSVAHTKLLEGDKNYMYWTCLGHTYQWTHTTTVDKFLYQLELRTGAGAHFKYKEHMMDVGRLWFRTAPASEEFVLVGQ